jgi:hypothetical protein
MMSVEIPSKIKGFLTDILWHCMSVRMSFKCPLKKQKTTRLRPKRVVFKTHLTSPVFACGNRGKEADRVVTHPVRKEAP